MIILLCVHSPLKIEVLRSNLWGLPPGTPRSSSLVASGPAPKRRQSGFPPLHRRAIRSPRGALFRLRPGTRSLTHLLSLHKMRLRSRLDDGAFQSGAPFLESVHRKLFVKMEEKRAFLQTLRDAYEIKRQVCDCMYVHECLLLWPPKWRVSVMLMNVGIHEIAFLDNVCVGEVLCECTGDCVCLFFLLVHVCPRLANCYLTLECSQPLFLPISTCFSWRFGIHGWRPSSFSSCRCCHHTRLWCGATWSISSALQLPSPSRLLGEHGRHLSLFPTPCCIV